MTQAMTDELLSLAAKVEPYRPEPWEATHTLDRQIARARKEMGEEVWQRLNAEWDDD